MFLYHFINSTLPSRFHVLEGKKTNLCQGESRQVRLVVTRRDNKTILLSTSVCLRGGGSTSCLSAYGCITFFFYFLKNDTTHSTRNCEAKNETRKELNDNANICFPCWTPVPLSLSCVTCYIPSHLADDGLVAHDAVPTGGRVDAELPARQDVVQQVAHLEGGQIDQLLNRVLLANLQTAKKLGS